MKISEKVVFTGKKVRVSECQMDFGANGKPIYELIRFDTDTGVSILPVTENGVILINHYQLGLDKSAWTIPTGGLGEGEDPAKRAMLELREETGYAAKELTLLCRTQAYSGYIASSPGYIYTAKGLFKSPLKGDEPFDIEVKEFNWKTVLNMVKLGEIIESRAMIALLYYQQYNVTHE